MLERRNITDRGQWLAWRGGYVGASEAGALFGVHPYVTALKLYARMRGVVFPDEDNKVLRRGRWLEPAVGKAVSELRPDWQITAPDIYVTDSETKLACTPDFFIAGDPRGPGVLQTKSVAPHIFTRDWLDGSEPPLWITLQSATEMMLTECSFGVIAALTVDPFAMDCHLVELPRNPAAEAKIKAAAIEFWHKVERAEEPEPDFGRDDDVIRALHPQESPGKEVDLSGNNFLLEQLAMRAHLKRTIKRAEDRIEQIDAEIRYLIGDAERVVGLPDWRITYKTGFRQGYTVASKTMRILRILDRRAKDAADD